VTLEVIEAYEKQEETIKMLRLLNDHSNCIEEGRIRMARIKELEQQSEKYREACQDALLWITDRGKCKSETSFDLERLLQTALKEEI
jgi:hypothetical protein